MSSAVASLLTVFSLWLSLALFCCAGLSNQTYEVTYSVAGGDNKRASVTYSNPQGGTEQQEIRLPWSHTMTVRSGEFLYISAQNKDDYGLVYVSISVNGRKVKDALSNGGYVIATADDRCCE